MKIIISESGSGDDGGGLLVLLGVVATRLAWCWKSESGFEGPRVDATGRDAAVRTGLCENLNISYSDVPLTISIAYHVR
jgi:hypothetical protein